MLEASETPIYCRGGNPEHNLKSYRLIVFHSIVFYYFPAPCCPLVLVHFQITLIISKSRVQSSSVCCSLASSDFSPSPCILARKPIFLCFWMIWIKTLAYMCEMEHIHLSGDHIYLRSVSLMNDIIILLRWNTYWQWVSLDLSLVLVCLPRGSRLLFSGFVLQLPFLLHPSSKL